MKKICGFTLAETLITLVIVGVVAALTVPTLIAKYQKEETASKLKLANSILAQSVQKAWQDWGSVDRWDMNISNQAFGEKYLKPYVNYTKECKTMTDGCWKTDDFYGYYDLNKRKIQDSVPYSLILNNGMVVGINNLSGYQIWSYIVDINGKKKPNRMGRDVFSFYLYNPKVAICSNSDKTSVSAGIYIGGAAQCGPPHLIYPREQLLSSSLYRACNKNADGGGPTPPGAGTACGAVIARDGWQIKDDYPW